ncbi:MAG: diacylglycerol kinase family protein [Candidatus Sericytochromatia bacterium]|nr:diacylglycerol kinase family protein [Candidatus Sericytochromatia bacterium]
MLSESSPPLQLDLPSRDVARRLAVVIHNPAAGSGPTKQRVEFDAVRERFETHGWQCGFLATRFQGDGAEAARLALAAGADMVVAMGGDGTVNEVVQALAYQPVPLGVIPTGTINILARELNLPLDYLKTIDALVTGEPRTIDLGRANGRYFACMIGLGYDGDATLNLLPQLKAWSGPFAYCVAAFQTYTRHKAVRARITLKMGHKTRKLRRLVYMMVVSNGGLYAGGVLKFTPEANMADGILDVCVIRSGRWYRALLHGLLTLLGQLRQVSDVEFFQATSVHFKSSRPFPYQLDGDPAGHSPVTVEIAAGALRVMAPPLVAPASD